MAFLLLYRVRYRLRCLLLRFGSKMPFGAVTVAVSEILPCAEALIVPVAL